MYIKEESFEVDGQRRSVRLGQPFVFGGHLTGFWWVGTGIETAEALWQGEQAFLFH